MAFCVCVLLKAFVREKVMPSFLETQACMCFEPTPDMVTSSGDSSLADGKCQGLAPRGVYPPLVLLPLAVADGRQVPDAGAVDPALVTAVVWAAGRVVLGDSTIQGQPHSFIARDLPEEFAGCWLLVDYILIEIWGCFVSTLKSFGFSLLSEISGEDHLGVLEP